MHLDALGWNDFFARAHRDGLEPARVAAENRGHCLLWTAAGDFSARIAGGWADLPPVTGDWVGFDRETAMIRALLPRRTKISRKRAGRVWSEHVLGANIDVLFVVTGLDGDFNIRRIERYLVAAHEGGAEPVLVLNKSDLCADPLEKLRMVDAIAPGVPAVLLCAFDAASCAQLWRHVEPAQTAALVGSSGAGKSTIVNTLLGRAVQPTKEVRASDDTGRHTTTGRHLFLLDQGWMLLDTPGLREFEPWASEDSAAAVFPEIQELASKCRFRDCQHRDEPGCAVAGVVDEARMESFRKLQGEMARQDRMTDARAASEHNQKIRELHRAQRKIYKLKKKR